MNPKLELLYVISRLSWGGLEMNILRLANEMIKRGHSVTIACNLKGRLFQELVKIFNGEKRKIETVGLSSNFAENLATLLKILKQKQFSIIHIFNSSDLKLVSLAVILQAGNQALILDPQIGVGVSKKDLLHKIFYKKVDTVIAISKDVANGFLQNLPIDENKLKLIYPGVDVGKFRFSEQSRKKIRDEFNLEDGFKRFEIFETKWKIEQLEWSPDGMYFVFRVVNITPEVVERKNVKTGEIYFFDVEKRNLYKISSGSGFFNFRFIDDTRIVFDKGFENDAEIYMYDLFEKKMKQLTNDDYPDGVFGIPKVLGFSA